MMRLILFFLCFSSFAYAGSSAELLESWQLESAINNIQASQLNTLTNNESWNIIANIKNQQGCSIDALVLLQQSRMVHEKNNFLYQTIYTSAQFSAEAKTLETRHFKIKYLNKDELMAYLAQDVLEKAYLKIGSALHFFPAESFQKIIVEIFPNAQQLAGATGLTIQDIERTGTIAVCKYHKIFIISPLSTAFGYEWADTLAHELTHLIISKKSHNHTPIWLHEGIAKYFETGWRDAIGENLDQEAVRLLKKAIQTKKFVTFAQMHPSMAKLGSQEKASLAFAEVHTVIEYIAKKYGKDMIASILSTLATEQNLDRALEINLHKNLSQLELDWHVYLSKKSFSTSIAHEHNKIELQEVEQQQDMAFSATDINNEVAKKHARLGEMLELRQHNDAAIYEYTKAYEVMGVENSSLIVHLANLHMKQHQEKTALTLIEKALAQHPRHAALNATASYLYIATQQYLKAKQAIELVLLHNPYNPNMYRYLIEIYEHEKNQPAVAQYQRFLTLAEQKRPLSNALILEQKLEMKKKQQITPEQMITTMKRGTCDS